MPFTSEQSLAAPSPVRQPEHSRPLSLEEAEDFATVLRVSADALHTSFRAGEPATDREPLSYDDLVADPIKNRVAADPAFFARIKRDVALALLPRYFPRTPADRLRVLDVGCGTGELMRALEGRFGRVQGCDPSLSMVCRAGENAVYMPLEMSLPFETHSFDVATCACVYHHIEPELRRAHLREIRRVLRPGGVLMIFEHNPRNPLTRYIVSRCPIDAAAQLLDARMTRRLLRSASYHRVRVRYYLFLPQRVYKFARCLERPLSVTTLGGQYCAIARKPV